VSNASCPAFGVFDDAQVTLRGNEIFDLKKMEFVFVGPSLQFLKRM